MILQLTKPVVYTTLSGLTAGMMSTIFPGPGEEQFIRREAGDQTVNRWLALGVLVRQPNGDA